MVNSIWLKNFCGAKCTDMEMQNIPQPYIETQLHVSMYEYIYITYYLMDIL